VAEILEEAAKNQSPLKAYRSESQICVSKDAAKTDYPLQYSGVVRIHPT
jgi:hypothetical protein